MTVKCTSNIVVTTLKDKTIQVQWTKTHYGHDKELQFIRISKEDKLNVASQLVSGVRPAR